VELALFCAAFASYMPVTVHSGADRPSTVSSQDKHISSTWTERRLLAVWRLLGCVCGLTALMTKLFFAHLFALLSSDEHKH
jgi:hypothetical protein